MPAASQFLSVSPIGETDPLSLPVADVEQAVKFYTTILGFTLSGTQDGPPKLALLSRDDVTLGLAENGGDPERASCYISVSDVTGLQEEYKVQGVNVSEVGEMDYDGKTYQVFWAKDPDGICYCIGKSTDPES